jgi:hypothetical protein
VVKKVILIVISVFLFLIGVGLAIGGGALMAVFGSDNTLTSGPQRVSTQTAALVVTADDINGATGFAASVDQPTLRITISSPDKAVFVGVGRKADVERYLSGVAVDDVKDIDVDPFRLNTEPRAGSSQPAAPTAQSFWVAKGSGRQATLIWKVSDGSYQLVLMNADASPSVAVDGRFSLTVPHLFAIGIGILVAGCVLVLIAVVLFIIGVRIRTAPPAAQGAGYGPPPGYGPPTGSGPPAGYGPPPGSAPPSGYGPPAGYGPPPSGYEPPSGSGAPPENQPPRA